MKQKNDFLDRARIASPCSVGWENMSGDERVRFCNQCSLHVYNISEMTKEQVSSLVARTEGRLCARIYRRDDGTILTRDCPVGLRALRRRVSKMAGAALTAILSLCSGVIGQTQSQDDKKCTRIIALKVMKMVAKDGQVVLSGVIMDEMGAVVPAAKITLINERTKKSLTETSSDGGEFKFSELTAGNYSLEIEAMGFKSYRQKKLTLNSREAVRINATLLFNEATTVVTVGLLISDPQFEYSNGTTTLSGDFIRKLPIP
jgi:hypothetical protein